MPTRPKRPISDTDVPVERSNFHAYLAVNPNYFGSLPDLGFPVELVKQGDTAFEQLDCVSYSPERSRLEATFDIKRSFGYSGGLCSTGSFEHVRFFVSYDEGVDWTDVGLASVNVHDIAAGTVCDKTPYPPLSYTVGVNFSPRRNWCGIPVLPLVRAILSWEIVPDPTKPNQPPIWGNVHDCHVQIPPRRFVVDDVLSQLATDVKLNLPPYVLQQPIVPVPPIPDPGRSHLSRFPSSRSCMRARRRMRFQRTGSRCPISRAPLSRAPRRCSRTSTRRSSPARARSTSQRSSSSSSSSTATRRTRSSSASASTTTPTSSSARSASSGPTASRAGPAQQAAPSTSPTGRTSVTTARTPISAPPRSRRMTTPSCRPVACATPPRCRSTSVRSASRVAPLSSAGSAPSCRGAPRRRRRTRTRCPTGATSWTHASSCGPVARTTGTLASRSSAAWRQLGSASGRGSRLPGATIVENGTLLPELLPLRWAGQLARSA